MDNFIFVINFVFMEHKLTDLHLNIKLFSKVVPVILGICYYAYYPICSSKCTEKCDIQQLFLVVKLEQRLSSNIRPSCEYRCKLLFS